MKRTSPALCWDGGGRAAAAVWERGWCRCKGIAGHPLGACSCPSPSPSPSLCRARLVLCRRRISLLLLLSAVAAALPAPGWPGCSAALRRRQSALPAAACCRRGRCPRCLHRGLPSPSSIMQALPAIMDRGREPSPRLSSAPPAPSSSSAEAGALPRASLRALSRTAGFGGSGCCREHSSGLVQAANTAHLG